MEHGARDLGERCFLHVPDGRAVRASATKTSLGRSRRADGTVYVAFVNGQNSAVWETGKEARDQLPRSCSSIDGGRHAGSAPVDAVDLEDGSTTAASTWTAVRPSPAISSASESSATSRSARRDPLRRFADNRAGTHDVPNPVTDMNVYVVTSTDGGATWSAPVGVDTGPATSGSPGPTSIR